MDDRQSIEQLYNDMYRAMVRKDRAELERIHDDSFVLHHMTGLCQRKQEYINSIMEGSLNYFEEETESVDILVSGNEAIMDGKSKVTAAVFGGGRHTWRLALKFRLQKKGDQWLLTEAKASTY